jgi:hypothetical protein
MAVDDGVINRKSIKILTEGKRSDEILTKQEQLEVSTPDSKVFQTARKIPTERKASISDKRVQRKGGVRQKRTRLNDNRKSQEGQSR